MARSVSRSASFCSTVRSCLYLRQDPGESARDRGVAKGTERDVPLDKDEEGLVPQNRHDARVTLKPDKVEHERVDNLVRQRVFLVKQHTDEETVGACEEWRVISPGLRHERVGKQDGPV